MGASLPDGAGEDLHLQQPEPPDDYTPHQSSTHSCGPVQSHNYSTSCPGGRGLRPLLACGDRVVRSSPCTGTVPGDEPFMTPRDAAPAMRC